ncbi:MAG: hypothetical protein IJT66_03165, partial [Clostridia bacterium]|nr:hypothetical protein [Clostridia bacterium]
TIFSSLLHTGETVEIAGIFEQIKPIFRATADAKDLFDLVANVVAILGEKDDRCIALSIENGNITAKTKTATGAASASIPATDTVPTDKDYFYNSKWLLDCLHHAVGPTALTLDQRGCLLIEANHNRMCVMPRGPARIKAAEPKKEKKAKQAA